MIGLGCDGIWLRLDCKLGWARLTEKWDNDKVETEMGPQHKTPKWDTRELTIKWDTRHTKIVN